MLVFIEIDTYICNRSILYLQTKYMNSKKYQLETLLRWELYQVMSDALKYTDRNSEGMPDSFLDKVQELHAIFDVYDEELTLERRVSSPEIFEAEEMRDYAVRKVYGIIHEYSDYKYDKQKEAAAKKLINIFKPYGTGSNISRMRQDIQTAVILLMLQNLETETAKQHIATLHLTEAVQDLAHSNRYFEREQLTRNKKKAEYVKGVVKSARNELINHFLEFADLINALAIVDGEEKYADLKQFLNTLVRDYFVAAKRRNRKAKEEEEMEEAQ